MELAKVWFRDCRPSPPLEMLEVLAKEERLDGLRLTRAVPELVTPLPEKGEGRNHDLAIIGHTPQEQVTICIEAKADGSSLAVLLVHEFRTELTIPENLTRNKDFEDFLNNVGFHLACLPSRLSFGSFRSG